MKIGNIILYKNIKAFLSCVQRTILGTIYSHLSIYIGKDELNLPMEFEANVQVDRTTFHYNPEHQDIFEIIGVPEDVMKEVMTELIQELEEKTYSFIAWIAIALRRLFEALGFKKAKGWNILWGWGIHCTEIGWHQFDKLDKKEWDKPQGWKLFIYKVRLINPNLFHPGDCQELTTQFRDIIFRKV